ncbi:MAG: stage II sporulation protein M [Clostridiales bacterium]|nr:stage II sporulation protein M [Clostridiales bacterium]
MNTVSSLKIPVRPAFAAAAVILLSAGVCAGSVYLMSLDDTTELCGFLGSYFNGLSEGANRAAAFKNALKSNTVLVLVMFLSGFFRIGAAAVGLCLARQGFVMGFTTAALYRIYGMRGMLVSLSFLPASVLSVPAMLMYASLCASLSPVRAGKKIILYYIFVTFFIITIFCAASFLEGYLTTTFMQSASKFLGG